MFSETIYPSKIGIGNSVKRFKSQTKNKTFLDMIIKFVDFAITFWNEEIV